jgi:hypothetical protein
MGDRGKLINDIQSIIYRYIHRFYLIEALKTYKSLFVVRVYDYIYDRVSRKAYNFRFCGGDVIYVPDAIYNKRGELVAQLPENY